MSILSRIDHIFTTKMAHNLGEIVLISQNGCTVTLFSFLEYSGNASTDGKKVIVQANFSNWSQTVPIVLMTTTHYGQ